MPDLFFHALLLDGAGGAAPFEPDSHTDISAGEDNCWIDVNRLAADAPGTLKKIGLDKLSIRALLAEETRPRFTVHGAAAIINFRGVNLNPAEQPEDMVSIRIWTNGHHVISARGKRLLAIGDIRERLEKGEGPTSSAGLVVAIAEHLTDRMAGTLQRIEDKMDELEDMAPDREQGDIRKPLSQLRLQALILRRFIAPQRDALTRMAAENLPWITDQDRMRLREVSDRITRYVEDLDSIRDRAIVVHDEITARIAEDMNRTMLVLTIVAGIFLPLSFVTGLLGINVGGMPGADNDAAFWWVTGGLGILGVIEFFLLKRLGWV